MCIRDSGKSNLDAGNLAKGNLDVCVQTANEKKNAQDHGDSNLANGNLNVISAGDTTTPTKGKPSKKGNLDVGAGDTPTPTKCKPSTTGNLRGNSNQAVVVDQDSQQEVRRDILKARKFQSLLKSGLLPSIVKSRHDEIEATRGQRGGNYRQDMTELIEGVIDRVGPKGKLQFNQASTYYRSLYAKLQKKYLDEKFEVLMWEEACTKCGSEAGLISAIQRKKCFKKSPEEKADILWPKVEFGRSTQWTMEEQFDKGQSMSLTDFDRVESDFQSIADQGLDDLVQLCGNPDSASSSSNLPAILSAVKDPPCEDGFFASDVDALDKAREDLSAELVNFTKTDSLIDKLIQKATEAQDEVSKASKDKKVDPSPRLTRALQEILLSLIHI